jgi:hypothetical protein
MIQSVKNSYGNEVMWKLSQEILENHFVWFESQNIIEDVFV